MSDLLGQSTRSVNDQQYRDCPCDDCGVNTHFDDTGIGEYYMVLPRTWGIATADVGVDATYLCVECIERRLGRTLNAYDFLFCGLNCDPKYYRSRRLVSRMSAVP